MTWMTLEEMIVAARDIAEVELKALSRLMRQREAAPAVGSRESLAIARIR